MKEDRTLNHVRKWDEAEWRQLLGVGPDEKILYAQVQRESEATRKGPRVFYRLVVQTERPA